jgi:hypothetical protein
MYSKLQGEYSREHSGGMLLVPIHGRLQLTEEEFVCILSHIIALNKVHEVTVSTNDVQHSSGSEIP